MIPDENKLGAYVRHLRDHGILDAVGDWREYEGVRVFGIRIGGNFYSVAELRHERNRKAVLRRDFAAVRASRPAAKHNPSTSARARHQAAVRA